jgi:uncharacterized protein (DUF1015 family)
VAEIQPFRGIRYAPKRVGDLSAVITPPYDVISIAEQARHYKASPYNVIRLDDGQERPADSTETPPLEGMSSPAEAEKKEPGEPKDTQGAKEGVSSHG